MQATINYLLETLTQDEVDDLITNHEDFIFRLHVSLMKSNPQKISYGLTMPEEILDENFMEKPMTRRNRRITSEKIATKRYMHNGKKPLGHYRKEGK